ncbi:MAG: serine hydrolase domain-containing protein [Coxiellaceae bacterium]|nr:serine hydrolase domain-containing protein [Coxiellaceae bacterium]
MKILVVTKHNKTAVENADDNVARLQAALDQKQFQYDQITDEQTLEEISKQISDGKYDIVFFESGVNSIDISQRLARDSTLQKPKMVFIDGKIEDVADKAFSDATFSGTVAVYKGDETLFAKGYQAENRYIPAVSNNEHTLFNIASMDKMITGLAMVMLAKKEYFSLDDKIIDHLLPNYPYRHLFQNFTFHELLTHTSGLWRGGLMEGDAFGAQMANFEKVKEFLPMFFSDDQKLQGPPSTDGKHSYSNAGYLLLGLFIEATQEGGYYQFIHDNVLT